MQVIATQVLGREDLHLPEGARVRARANARPSRVKDRARVGEGPSRGAVIGMVEARVTQLGDMASVPHMVSPYLRRSAGFSMARPYNL